jgi:hypothetical protein
LAYRLFPKDGFAIMDEEVNNINDYAAYVVVI